MTTALSPGVQIIILAVLQWVCVYEGQRQPPLREITAQEASKLAAQHCRGFNSSLPEILSGEQTSLGPAWWPGSIRGQPQTGTPAVMPATARHETRPRECGRREYKLSSHAPPPPPPPSCCPAPAPSPRAPPSLVQASQPTLR